MTGETLTFVDTNVLVYAYDRDSVVKRPVAEAILEELWRTDSGVISSQVLQEFYNTITRKIPQPLDRAQARHVVTYYSRWPVQLVRPATITSASELEDRVRLSFWDALIVTTARLSGARTLLSEDMQSGRTIDGVTIENPFA